MLDFLQEKNILRAEGNVDIPYDYCEILKGEFVMLVAFGTFGALYLAGMIAMTVHGLKD